MILLWIGLGLLLSGSAAKAEIYRWVDDQGNVHYSDKPHQKAKTVTVQPTTRGLGLSQEQMDRQKNLTEDLAKKRLEQQKLKKQKRQQREALEKNCIRLKNRLRNYQDADYLFTRDDEGKKKRMKHSDKKQEIQQLKDQIAEKCSS